MPLEERKCGVWVVDTARGQTVAFLQFQEGVQEIFAIQILPGIRYPDVLTEESTHVANSILLPDEALKEVVHSTPAAKKPQ